MIGSHVLRSVTYRCRSLPQLATVLVDLSETIRYPRAAPTSLSSYHHHLLPDPPTSNRIEMYSFMHMNAYPIDPFPPGQSIEALAESLGIDMSNTPWAKNCESTTNQDVLRPPINEFDEDVDQTFSTDPLVAPPNQIQLIDDDWNLYFDFSPSALAVVSASMHSYTSSESGTLPVSPSSSMSDETAVSFSGSPPTVDGLDAQKDNVDLQGLQDFTGAALLNTNPVMSLMFTPSIETPPLACSSSSDSERAMYGQPQQQHLPGAVAASARGVMSTQADILVPLTTGSSYSFPASSLSTEVSTQSAPVEDPSQSASAPAGAPTAPRSRKRQAARGANQKSAKRQRKPQDKTKKYICPVCGNGMARTHNLRVHIHAVHEGGRAHACKHPGCDRSFSRKHDMLRHYQSEHTSLGSPRRKPATD
ncbi:hypothetical protein BD413DRAFT_214759 [Trametes elegans]|nr:hypothetical protein BD413DRAFT_214759 [Trametes elegans]